MEREWKPYLSDILTSIEWIERHTEGMTEFQFLNSVKTQDSVIRRFEIIGEAAKHIPDAVRSQHPNIPWKKLTGMRDVVIHDYSGVDFVTVWNTVEENLPRLKQQLKDLLNSLQNT